MPLTQLSALVLPAPFGPISANNSPGRTSNEISSRTVRPPKRRRRCSTVNSAIPPPRPAILLDVAIAAPRAVAAAEVEFLHVLVASQARTVAVEDDAAVFHHIGIVGDFERDR